MSDGVPAPEGGDTRDVPGTLTVGAVRETASGERRVAVTPAVVPTLVKAGLRVLVEAGAGERAGFPDALYADRGAEVVSREEALGAGILVAVRVLGGDPENPEIAALQPGQAVVGMAAPFAVPALSAAIATRGATLFSLELAPRITRAQAVDVLSSQAAVAGYRGVLLAAEALPKMFPLMTTAAGTIAPARVFVVGAGVAGLSAIATARRLGAVVEAYDVRPAVKEEVQSLGARFLELPLETDQDNGSGAYAAAMSEEQLRLQRELMAKTLAGSDVVITTAQVQGAKAPILVTKEMVAGMAPGSVLVDLAAEQGGNCEVTLRGRTVDADGVRVIGPENLPSGAAYDASLMYAKNVASFLALLVVDGALALDEDEIVRETTVCRDGKVVNERVRDALGSEEGVAR